MSSYLTEMLLENFLYTSKLDVEYEAPLVTRVKAKIDAFDHSFQHFSTAPLELPKQHLLGTLDD